MSTDPTTDARKLRNILAGCLIAILAVIVFPVLALVGLLQLGRWQEDKNSRERWDSQIAEIKAGKTTSLRGPEPKFLEEFVRDQPEVAAKITALTMNNGNITDERLSFVKQFSHLETIYFDESMQGDAFLKRIASMVSIRSLSFYKTGISDEGVQAVASFPNLRCLKFDNWWHGVDLKPLGGHKGIEEIGIESISPSKQWIDVMASLPNLHQLDLEEDEPMSKADFANLQKALPKVKIERGK